jgi:tRNA(adenine34) deaminase
MCDAAIVAHFACRARNLRECAKIHLMDHQHYMQLAFADARGAYAAGNRPVAALIVRDDHIIGRGCNTVYADHDLSAHAEVAAIRVACRETGKLDLAGATLYSTLEPCPMCLWMILEAKIARVVLGARHAALKRTDTGDYSVETFLALTLRPLDIVTGVLEDECVELRLRWMREQKK